MAVLSLIVLIASAVPSFAQTDRWTFQQLTQQGLGKLSPRIAIDAWGNRHVTWVMKDPVKSGLQIFYSHDISGRFGVPFQVTEMGTVYDSIGSATTPYVFKLDALGRAHVVYVANVLNHLHIYYTNNVTGDFQPARLITTDAIHDQDRAYNYDMTVDSSGVAHVMWMKPINGQVDIYYWNSRSEGTTIFASVPCRLGFGCKVVDPDIEFNARDTALHVAYRAYRGDTSYIYHLTRESQGGVNIGEVELGLQRAAVMNGRADLRVRMAIDSLGFVHMLAPFQEINSRYKLSYVSNSAGFFRSSFLDNNSQDSNFADFDIASDGGVTLAAVWNVARRNGIRETGVVEKELDRYRGWETVTRTRVPRLWDLSSPSPVYPEGNIARTAARNGRIEVVGHTYVPGDSTIYQVSLFSRSSTKPAVSYILPDAAAPGMSVVVEAFAPFRAHGSFGRDGFRGDTVAMTLYDMSDYSRVVIGPTVVSWDGRLASATIFVKPGAAPGPVRMRLRVGDTSYSDVFTFHIVEPQHIGDSTGHLKGGGVLGSGGIYGLRSPRGVMVVDSLILESGTFTVATTDSDPEKSGNQGYLPVTILSRGPIRIESGAALSVSAAHDSANRLLGNAGPGGGGGGSGGEVDGGAGYTGGGGRGRDEARQITGESIGTGDSVSGRWGGGRSLNGTPGGGVYAYGHQGQPSASSGGGTGHPFGASGSHGQFSEREPSSRSLGGFGGGSGGGRAFATRANGSGGGGGSNGGFGNSGYQSVDGEGNGGLVVGSAPVVPLAGGGGGGGGGYSLQGYATGGGGGGAILLLSGEELRIGGDLLANGANGMSAQKVLDASGGGGGGGGSIFLASKGQLDIASTARISARGGNGGAADLGYPGGNGGFGRVRIDGRMPDAVSKTIFPKSGYSGPATFGTSAVAAEDGAVVSGYGLPGKRVKVFIHPEINPLAGREWSYDLVREATVKDDSTWSVAVGSVGQAARLYIVAMQATSNARDNFAYEPAWVMSPAGGVILGKPAASLGLDSVHFECIRFDTCTEADLYITNTGDITDLVIRGTEVGGLDERAFSVQSTPGAIHAQDTRPVRVRFCPDDTGRFTATLKVKTNASPVSEKIVTITGCAVSGTLVAKEIVVDLGEICINECRDTVINLRNDGQAPLTVTDVGGDDLDIAVTAKTSLPITIEPNESKPLELKLCLKRFTTNGATLKISNTSIDPIYAKVRVTGVNAGANVAFDPAMDFGVIDRSKKDSCRTQTIQLTNRSTTAPVRVRIGRPASARFTIEAPAAAEIVIMPGASESLTVTFCGDTEMGDFADIIPITLGEGVCALDSSVRLSGRVAMAAAEFVIVAPTPQELIFPPTPVNTPSAYQNVTIRNVGTAAGDIASIIPSGAPGTDDDEIEIDLRGQMLPYTLDRDREITVGVRVRPKTAKEIEGVVRVSEQGGMWSEDVVIRGKGVKPGIQTNATLINFGSVRLGSQSVGMEVRIFNTGTAPTEVKTVEVNPPGQFVKISGPSGGTLPPGGAPIIMYYAFTPRAEGEQTATLTVKDTDGVEPQITLRGTGILEHASVVPERIDIDCVREGKDSLIVVELRNTGTHPMTVHNGQVLFGTEAFELMNPVFPHDIQPNESKKYTVRFRPIWASHTGLIQMQSSAEEPIQINLTGRTCTEITDVGLKIYDLSAQTGSNVVIPIRVQLGRPTKADVPYRLTLTFPYDLLAPLDAATRPDGRKATISGSISSQAEFKRGALGQVIVTGTMRPSSSLGEQLLVGIPMKVLLGSTFTGRLEIDDASFTLPGARLKSQGGVFVAEACDTAGGVIIPTGKYSLDQSYPNPSTPTAIIRYEIAVRDRVVLNLYDANGLHVKTLLDQVEDAGEHEFVLETATIPAGIYTYELISGRFRKTQRLVVVN